MTYAPPHLIRRALDNNAYGYPRGAERMWKPTVLMVIHITGNKRTVKMPDGVGPRSGCWAEVSYAARKGSDGPSAHTYLARNGEGIVTITPARFAAWSNGDLTSPVMAIPLIRRMVKAAASGTNPNELVFREVECVGYGRANPITDAQEETLAYLLARDSTATKLPIVAGETVGIHAWINSVDRSNCPFPEDRMRHLQAICARARVIKRELADPQPEPGEPPDAPGECDALRDELEAARGYAEQLENERASLLAVLGRVGALVAPFVEDEA